MADPTTAELHTRCRCKARPYTTCTNRATQEGGPCDPCRRDGGDGHPKART